MNDLTQVAAGLLMELGMVEVAPGRWVNPKAITRITHNTGTEFSREEVTLYFGDDDPLHLPIPLEDLAFLLCGH